MKRPRLTALIASRRADRVPKGWRTAEQMAAAEGNVTSDGHFHYTLKRAVAAGILERRAFRLVNRANAARAVLHYRYTRKARAA